MNNLLSLLSGLIFGLGLIVSGMTNPAKVLDFLDIAGAWDPSLALVMGGAIAIGSERLRHCQKTLTHSLSAYLCNCRRKIDRRLIGGDLTLV